MMRTMLREGLRMGDLEDLILPMISVDQYESKLDDNAIVVGFYVHDKDAANDLNRFIQKSPVDLLDSEVSPAPDQHGYYLVFVEFINDKLIVDNIESLLEEISNLVADDSWQMQIRGIDKVLPFSRKRLEKRFARMRKEIVDGTDVEDGVLEFFVPSDLTNVIAEDQKVELAGPYTTVRGIISDFGSYEDVYSRNQLHEQAISLDFSDTSESMKISQMLGEGWTYSKIGEQRLIQSHVSDTVLLLRHVRLG